MTEQKMPEHERIRSARKAGLAAFVGTTIEWYDFYIYATAASLVFGELFFPGTDRLTGIAAAFATYAVGFFARPLGGVIFGHIGDRIGRRSALVITLLMMGSATFAVGLLPTAASIGLAAPVLLVVLRLVQGIAVGGEWGGAVLMAVEHAPPDRKTFYGAFPQLGNSAGALLATGFFAILSTLDGDALAEWAWRLPFLASAVLIVVGLVVRLAVEESPVFSALTEAERVPTSTPLVQAVRTNWRTILLGIGILPVAVGGYYLTTTFVTAYATGPDVGLSETTVLNALSFAAVVELVATLAVSWIGDKVGRIRVVIWGFAGVAILAIPQFLVVGSDSTVLLFAVFGLMRLAMAMTYGPIAAVLAQMFGPTARYTSISLTYQIAGALFGGLSPVVATLLLQATGSVASSIALLMAMCLSGVLCIRHAPQLAEEPVESVGDEPARSPERARQVETTAG